MRPLAEGFQTPLVTRRDVADDAAVNECRFPLVAKLVRLVEGGRAWWRDWWLRLSILFLFAQVGFLLNMWWFVGERTASGEDALIRFFDSLVGIASVFLAGAVTIATCYSASRAARALDLTEDLQAAERTSERKGRINALVGAGLEVAAYGAWMAELQDEGRKISHRLLPEPVAQRELVIASWRQLSDSAVAASKALERIRYDDPDLFHLGGFHYDLVLDLQRAAFAGDSDTLQNRAADIRSSADALWSAIRPWTRPAVEDGW